MYRRRRKESDFLLQFINAIFSRLYATSSWHKRRKFWIHRTLIFFFCCAFSIILWWKHDYLLIILEELLLRLWEMCQFSVFIVDVKREEKVTEEVAFWNPFHSTSILIQSSCCSFFSCLVSIIRIIDYTYPWVMITNHKEGFLDNIQFSQMSYRTLKAAY